MTQQENTVSLRGILTKKPFRRILPGGGVPAIGSFQSPLEQAVVFDKLEYQIETQEDYIRQLDPNSHAINDPDIYKTFMQKDEDGLFYEMDFPRYAFPFQQEILDDRLARLSGNDTQFDLAERDDDDSAWEAYDNMKAGWSDKGMERAKHFLIKSVLATGDGAFVGYLDNGKFYWRVLSYLDGDVLYPHYDMKTGRLNVFARAYTNFDNIGIIRKYVDVWTDAYYYRFVDYSENDKNKEKGSELNIEGFNVDGYELDYYEKHGFDEIPVAYKRNDFGPCWSAVQETIEHYEAAFSRLAQSNHDFGLPIMYLQGDGKQIHEIAASDMSYASKILVIPSDGKAGFLERQDASGAYKAELDELRKKIYEGAMVVKAPELKSGDTPAAAIKLLYSDSYNKALLETQEYDECLTKMINIFKWGYGIESNMRLAFINTRIVAYISPYIPINDAEMIQNLSMAVQNGFLSKQTASEKCYYATPNEWSRILQEKHDEKAQELLLEEQRLEIQTDSQIETQEALSDIQTDAQIDVLEAQADINKEEDKADKVSMKRGNVRTGRGRGRPNRSGKVWDENGNWEGRNNWEQFNRTH